MKSTYIQLFFIGIASIAIMSGCGSKTGASSATGWEYNNPDNGGFEVNEYLGQATGPGLVFIEGGSYVMGRSEQDVNFKWNNTGKRVTVNSFYMDETEVKNVDWREYLHWLSRVFIDYPEVVRRALPDTNVWRNKMAYNEPYVEYYLRHPAYNEYPVVGVSWLQAKDYSAWRTDRVNENILISQGILQMDVNQSGDNNFNTDAYLAGQYEGLVKKNLPSKVPGQEERRVNLSDGILLPMYRLPTETEWEFAASALVGNTYEERILEMKIYPWNGHNVRNDSPANLGITRANFRRGRGDFLGVAGYLNDNAAITAEVKSYWPNDYGLYCMAGNVSEWVMDVYRTLTFEDMDEFRPFRGNVFQKYVKDEEGNLAPKDSLGRLQKVDITEDDAKDRENYTKSDYKNYLDGDLQSSVDFLDASKDGAGSSRMYNQDPADLNTLINDQTRVIKGGSWLDRAYYLSPGTRRYLQEDKSRVDLGFRCAMDRIGSPKGLK